MQEWNHSEGKEETGRGDQTATSRQRDFVWKIHMEWWDSLTIILWGNSWGYPLVNVKKKLKKITILNGKFNYINSTISAGPFSIAMLVYHRVIVGHHFMGIHWG